MDKVYTSHNVWQLSHLMLQEAINKAKSLKIKEPYFYAIFEIDSVNVGITAKYSASVLREVVAEHIIANQKLLRIEPVLGSNALRCQKLCK